MNEEVTLNQFLRNFCRFLPDRDYLRCLVFREKLYQLQEPLHRVVSSYKTIPLSERDPYYLLKALKKKLLCNPQFKNYPQDLFSTVVKVINYRCSLYGHLEKLEITDNLIASFNFRNLTFTSIIDEIEKLLRILNGGYTGAQP